MFPFQTLRLSSYAASAGSTRSPRKRSRRLVIGLSAVCVMTSSSGTGWGHTSRLVTLGNRYAAGQWHERVVVHDATRPTQASTALDR